MSAMCYNGDRRFMTAVERQQHHTYLFHQKGPSVPILPFLPETPPVEQVNDRRWREVLVLS